MAFFASGCSINPVFEYKVPGKTRAQQRYGTPERWLLPLAKRILEQVLAASTAQRLEVEEELRASAEELLRVNTELHGAREQVTELSTVRAELEAGRAATQVWWDCLVAGELSEERAQEGSQALGAKAQACTHANSKISHKNTQASKQGNT